jgi:uncharacterized protein involved in exopolysaccharide biosynthesis
MKQVEIPDGVTLPGAMRPPEAEFAYVAAVPLRAWRLIVLLAVIAGLIGILIYRFVPPTYTATTSFVPEAPSSRLPSSLLGMADLAGQLGVSLGSDAARSPRFYTAVINSRQLVERALVTWYPNPRESTRDSVTLLSVLNPAGASQNDKLANGVRTLRKMMITQLDNQTGVLRLSIRSRYPSLSAGIANRYVAAVNDFNARQRQSQARERRLFIERRIAAVEQELRTAESNVRSFYERNRKYDQSPQLKLEEDRLRRDLDMHQQVYTTLQREYETSRIQEVNDTPVITVIDTAVAPTVPSSPRPLAVFATAAILGALCGVLVMIGNYYRDRR